MQLVTVHFATEQVSAAPPERVFALLEAGDRWQDWAGPFVPRSRWQVAGDPVGGVGAVRRLGVAPFVSLERITEHVPGRRLAYVIDSRGPYRDYRSTVELTPTEDGGTRIVWQSTFSPIVPGTGPLLRWFLAAVVRSFARNLARQA
ncbi:MAG: SRPBCC family protein [Actinomycetota bacterium]|nr:SRPBCC family protein [Actinomycetota bacterium]